MGHGAKDCKVKWKRPITIGGITTRGRRKRREEHEREISEIVLTITKNIAGASRLHPWEKSQHSIYRVPKNMRGVDENAYIPRLVSIGPFHHNEPNLQYMEEHKLQFLKRILKGGSVNYNLNDATSETESLVEEVGQHCCAGGGQFNQSTLIGNLALAMKELEHKTRKCYSETFNKMDSKSFVYMMILDGCFIVELLRLYEKCQKEYVDDPIFRTRWMMPILQRDFLMLENQLPFFVLQKLFELITTQGKESSLGKLTIQFFDPIMSREKKILDKLKLDGEHDHLLGLFRWSFLPTLKEKQPQSIGNAPLVEEKPLIDSEQNEKSLIGSDRELKESHCVTELNEAGITFRKRKNHLLGLFRWSFLPTLKEKQPQSIRNAPLVEEKPLIDSEQNEKSLIGSDRESKESHCVTERQLIHCVTELNEAGITFRKRKNHDLLDIEFNKAGVLEIPPLLIDDHTGPVFQNFVAYEQCDQRAEPYFTHYVLFFDSLVNSHKDVELLQYYNGIINHVLGSDEDVANLFNKLCKEVVYVVDNRYLSKQLKDINNYYGTKWHKWRAKWVHDYFSNPWSFFSLLAAIFLLLLTVIQTFISIFSYVRPPS